MVCQINSSTNQILQVISIKEKKKKQRICVIKSKVRKTLLKELLKKAAANKRGYSTYLVI